MPPQAVSGLVVGYDRTSNTTGAHVRLEALTRRQTFGGDVGSYLSLLTSGKRTSRRSVPYVCL